MRNLTIDDSGNADYPRCKTELLLFNRDGYVYEVMIIDTTMMNAATNKAFVARKARGAGRGQSVGFFSRRRAEDTIDVTSS